MRKLREPIGLELSLEKIQGSSMRLAKSLRHDR